MSVIRAIVLNVAAIVLFAASGCSTSGYWPARGNDALDVVTLQLGYGLGAKARVGPLQTGLLLDVGLGGLRGGAFQGSPEFWPRGFDTPSKVELLGAVVGFDGFHGPAHDSWRGKDYVAAHVGVLSLPCDPVTLDNEDTTYFNPWPFFSHLEVVAGLGLTVRVGINAAEFFDLLVGFAALDPLHDDFPSASQRAATYRLAAMRLFTWHRAMCAA